MTPKTTTVPHPFTGLRCSACGKDVAQIENITPSVLVLACPACSNRWTAREPVTAKH